MHNPGASHPERRAPKVEPPRVMECADCHTSFKDRTITEWDVHLPDGTYVTVCTPCFEKRDAARPPLKRDRSPIQGKTAVLGLKKKK